MELCHIILDGKGMPEDLATSVAITIFIGNGDIMNCGMHRGVNEMNENELKTMKIVEKVLRKNPEESVIAVMSLCKGAKKKVKVGIIILKSLM